jgi:hypothetical protein
VCGSAAHPQFLLLLERKTGESALILRVLCTRKISALNEKCTSEMLPREVL